MSFRFNCPECRAIGQGEKCFECGAEMDPPVELLLCPRCGKNWEKHSCKICGCCGEFWADCVCPDGPTEDFRTLYDRWDKKRCENCPAFKEE